MCAGGGGRTGDRAGLKIYVLAKAHDQVILGLVENGSAEKVSHKTLPFCCASTVFLSKTVSFCAVCLSVRPKVMAYVQPVSYQPDWGTVISTCIRTNPQTAQQLASLVVNTGVQVDNVGIVEAFIGMSMMREATAFALDALKGESTEEKDPLQVRARETAAVSASHSSQCD
eukprot:SAG22_NODE_391_length_11223_cov_7.451187_2_plen_171_part_00